MRVKDLIEKLQGQDQDADVEVWVSWSDDTAASDDGEEVEVSAGEKGQVVLRGWLSGCKGELEFVDEDEDED